METIEAFFQIPDYIAEGLQDGQYERMGGVVREAGSKQVVAWLRETAPNKLMTFAPKMLHAADFTGVLNLGLSACGFSLILYRLNGLENRIRLSQEAIAQVNCKLDLSFYGNFVSAIQQANSAFMMKNAENRRISAMQAIDRLLAAEHYFKNTIDAEIIDGSSTDDLLSTLSLAYVAEAQCHLELNEVEIAQSRISESIDVILPRSKRYVQNYFEDPRSLYAHEDVSNDVTNDRLLSIYQWFDSDTNTLEIVEERELKKLTSIKEEKYIATLDDIIDNYDYAVRGENATTRGKDGKDDDFLAGQRTPFKRIMAGVVTTLALPLFPVMNADHKQQNRLREKSLAWLPNLKNHLDRMEILKEEAARLEAYQTELEAIENLGYDYKAWQDLKPNQGKSDQQPFFWLVPKPSQSTS